MGKITSHASTMFPSAEVNLSNYKAFQLYSQACQINQGDAVGSFQVYTQYTTGQKHARGNWRVLPSQITD
jgi:hypothetical protein